jgi:hypothetical protein
LYRRLNQTVEVPMLACECTSKRFRFRNAEV